MCQNIAQKLRETLTRLHENYVKLSETKDTYVVPPPRERTSNVQSTEVLSIMYKKCLHINKKNDLKDRMWDLDSGS